MYLVRDKRWRRFENYLEDKGIDLCRQGISLGGRYEYILCWGDTLEPIPWEFNKPRTTSGWKTFLFRFGGFRKLKKYIK